MLLYKLLAATTIGLAAGSFSSASVLTRSTTAVSRSAVHLQFGNALGDLNNELSKDLEGLDDDVPMTKAEMKRLEKEAQAEMKRLKAEAAAAEASKKE